MVLRRVKERTHDDGAVNGSNGAQLSAPRSLPAPNEKLGELLLRKNSVTNSQLSEALKVRPEELPERVGDIVERLRAAEKEIEKHRLSQVLAGAGAMAAAAQDIHGVQVVAQRVEGASGGDVRTLALDVRGRLPGDRPGVVVVIGVVGIVKILWFP